MLALGIINDGSTAKRDFAQLGSKFSGHDVYPPTGLSDAINLTRFLQFLQENGGDSSFVMSTSHRLITESNFQKDFQTRLAALANEEKSDENLASIARFTKALSDAVAQKEKNQSHARKLLQIIESSVTKTILAEFAPILFRHKLDSEVRLFAVLDHLKEKYDASIADQNQQLITNFQHIGRAETKSQLSKLITAFEFHSTTQNDLLFEKNPELQLQVQGEELNERHLSDFNRDVARYRIRFSQNRNPATPVIDLPYQITTALGPIAVHNYKIERHVAAVRNGQNPQPPFFDAANEPGMALPDLPERTLVDPLVFPLTNREKLIMLRDRMESNPSSEIASYRKLVLDALRLGTPFADLCEEISTALAEDLPSENHVRPGIHAAFAALHGSSANASANSSHVLIGEILDVNQQLQATASANMGSASQLETRVRQLEEQLGGDVKRPRIQQPYPCKFWGADASGHLSCSREVKSGHCDYKHLHFPTVTTPPVSRWLNPAEMASMYGSSAPTTSGSSQAGLGQSL